MEQEEKQEQIDLIPEERLNEILSILLPWGYSHYEEHYYTGVSPYIGSAKNIITVVANDYECWESVLSICIEKFDENCDENDSLGFYKGIMKLIAPELYSKTKEFKGAFNVLDFNWAYDPMQDNVFPVKVIPKLTKNELS